MDARTCLTGALAVLFFGWFGPAAPEPAFGQKSKHASGAFPQSVEVIPGKLTVKIFVHEIKLDQETIPCWSFVTDGLAAQHQKEIIFTLRREMNQKPEDYPQDFLGLFETIFHLAEEGKLVDAGDITTFVDAGFLGDKTFRGIGYVQPEGFPGVETSSVPLLAGILLKSDEAPIAQSFGLTRVTALLGLKYHYYPCPTWSDLKREPVASLNGMEKSILGQIARTGVTATYYEEQNRVVLTVAPSARSALGKFLGQVPTNQPVALRTQPDPRANACLVWRPGQTQTMAITPPNSNGSRKTGAFLAMLPEQGANEIRPLEDGFALLLTDNTWQKMREALLSGSDLSIPPAGKDGIGISIEWQQPKGYTSAASGETYVAEKWNTYEPPGDSPPKELVAVSSSKIVLLTSEQDLQARTNAEDLAGYANTIEKVVDAFFTPPERRTKRDLTIQLAMTPGGHEVKIAADPNLSAADEQDLWKKLTDVAAPKVGGPVKFDYILNVWAIGRQQ